MRFGCVAREAAQDGAAWGDRIRRIDDWGFDVVLVPDHLGQMGPFPPLASAAAITDRLRVGVQVCNVNFWNPALLARDAATVDLLTDGRLELGLGAGHAQVEFEAIGLPYERPPSRIDLLDAMVPALRRLLAGETVTAGSPLDLHACNLGFSAAQTPVPLMVGGNGDRVLRIAATGADIVGLVGFTAGTGQVHTDLSHFTWEGLADRIAHVARCAGERFDALELSVLVQQVVVTDDRDAAVRAFAGEAAVAPDRFLDSPFLLIGSVRHLTEQLQRLRDDHGVSYVTTFEASAAALSVAMAALR